MLYIKLLILQSHFCAWTHGSLNACRGIDGGIYLGAGGTLDRAHCDARNLYVYICA